MGVLVSSDGLLLLSWDARFRFEGERAVVGLVVRLFPSKARKGCGISEGRSCENW